MPCPQQAWDTLLTLRVPPAFTGEALTLLEKVGGKEPAGFGAVPCLHRPTPGHQPLARASPWPYRIGKVRRLRLPFLRAALVCVPVRNPVCSLGLVKRSNRSHLQSVVDTCLPSRPALSGSGYFVALESLFPFSQNCAPFSRKKISSVSPLGRNRQSGTAARPREPSHLRSWGARAGALPAHPSGCAAAESSEPRARGETGTPHCC